MGSTTVVIDLSEGQYERLIAALEDHDECMVDLYADCSVTGTQMQAFVRMCRRVTRERWLPQKSMKAMAQPDQRGRTCTPT